MSFRYEGRVSLSTVNIRKEKQGEDRVLAMDLTIEAPSVPADTVAELLGIPAPGFRKTWWDSKGLPNLPNVEPLKLRVAFKGTDGQDSDHRVLFDAEDIVSTSVEDRAAIIDKFVVDPLEGHKCGLKFRIAISQPSNMLVELVTAALQNTLKLAITPDPQLDLGEPKQGEDAGADFVASVAKTGEELAEVLGDADWVEDPGTVDGKAGDTSGIPDKVQQAWDEEDKANAAKQEQRKAAAARNQTMSEVH